MNVLLGARVAGASMPIMRAEAAERVARLAARLVKRMMAVVAVLCCRSWVVSKESMRVERPRWDLVGLMLCDLVGKQLGRLYITRTHHLPSSYPLSIKVTLL